MKYFTFGRVSPSTLFMPTFPDYMRHSAPPIGACQSQVVRGSTPRDDEGDDHLVVCTSVPANSECDRRQAYMLGDWCSERYSMDGLAHTSLGAFHDA